MIYMRYRTEYKEIKYQFLLKETDILFLLWALAC